MTIVRAAAVQSSPVLYSGEGTVKKVVRKIIELSRQGVHFATFPETVRAVPSLLCLCAAACRDGRGTPEVD